MKRSYRRTKKNSVEVKQYRVNGAIKVPEVRYVDEENGISEVLPIKEALRRAEEQELDLVEVSPLANPPVVKVLDYGKIQYQKEKLMRKQKASQKAETKGIRLTARMSDHDFEVRLNNARKFLKKGARVKIELALRGREHQHLDLAKEMIEKFIAILASEYSVTIEQAPKKLGTRIHAMIAPKN